MRQRRLAFEKEPGYVLKVLREGTARANAVAEETLALAKRALRQEYSLRRLEFHTPE